VRPANQDAPEKDQTDTNKLTLQTLEQAETLIKTKSLKEALEYLRNVTRINKTCLETWFIDAQKRVNLDQSYTKFYGLMQAWLR
jgi:hypothetical protein